MQGLLFAAAAAAVMVVTNAPHCEAVTAVAAHGDAASYDELLNKAVDANSGILAIPDPDALSRSRLRDEPRYKVGVQVLLNATIDLSVATALIGGPPADVAGGAIRFDVDGFVWSAVVRSPGATALRLGLENLDMPPGTEFYLYNDWGAVDGPYTGADSLGRRTVFTRTLTGEAAYLQIHYTGPDQAAALAAIRFTLTEVARLDERFLLARTASSGPSPRSHCSNLNEDCVENAECDLHDPGIDSVVQNLRDATAHLLFQSGGGWYICTGGLIESLDGTLGHFLTAHHCVSTESEAASLEAYFHFTAPCPTGGGPTTSCDYVDAGNSETPSTFGATVIDTSDATDFTLLKLNGTPPAGTTHLPFSTAPVVDTDGAPLYRISHPSGAPQAYSEHAVDAGYSLCGPAGEFIYSQDIIGATEGGSSGSPVVNANGEIVGQLYGACGTSTNDECDAVNNRTYDGAFAATWQSSPLVRNALDACPGSDGDSDGDGVCDPADVCPGADDAMDGDSDGVPDGCDVCPAEARLAESTKLTVKVKGGSGDDRLQIKAYLSADGFTVDPTVTGVEVETRGQDGQTMHIGVLEGARWQDKSRTARKFIFRDKDGSSASANGFVSASIRVQAAKNRMRVMLKAKGVDVPGALDQTIMSASFLFGTDSTADECMSTANLPCNAKTTTNSCRD